MTFKKKNTNGFTLIELLVVVAIISLLSSVVFASLNSARKKSKDSFVRSEMAQFRTLLFQNYSQYGSYTALQPNINLIPGYSSCDQSFPPTVSGLPNPNSYIIKANSICVALVAQNSPDSNNNVGGGCPSCAFYAGYINPINPGTYPDVFSIMAWLPNTKKFLCMGSSGAQSETETGSFSVPGPAGCVYNP